MTAIRVSFIDYLNSLPLGWGILGGRHAGVFEIIHSSPAECADLMAAAGCEVGLIPAIEFQRIDGLRVLPDIAIASKNEARSVLLISRVPAEQIRRIALDQSSRTSVALLRILLGRHFGVQARFATVSPNLERMLAEFDAALLIGDPALKIDRSRFHVWDLAREWHKMTGRSFVFAFWAVRAGVDLGEAANYFYESKQLGLESIAEIARQRAPRCGLSEAAICDYLTNYLNYDLDPDNLAGLALFYRYAREEGLIETNRELECYPCPTPPKSLK